ncbi:MAG: hypothetical protein M1816_007141 [Peltula sp. TS41687]|nr:MAG: hypothetical protein M1816_007141 [Peltula sp. TS41687]
MSLGDFLTDESLGSWADEMENMPVAPTEHRTGYGERRGFSGSDRMGSGYGDRSSFAREQLPLPDKPPYTAHVGNLSFDVTESDITDYFAGCSVTNVRIVEDKLERKPKGFGYVEFGNVDGLKKALQLNGTQFSGRNIRVSVAEPRMYLSPHLMESKMGQVLIYSLSPYQRKIDQKLVISAIGPEKALFQPYQQNNAAAPIEDMVTEIGTGTMRLMRAVIELIDVELLSSKEMVSNWERKGPLSPLPQTGHGGNEGARPRTRDGPRDRGRQSPAWGEGRSQDGSRPPRKEYDRPHIDRAPTAPEMDNQWRSKMRPDPPAAKSPTISAATSKSSSPAAAAAPPLAPAVRPKLNLQKRTVSEAESTSPASAVSEAKASPFGGARPIDTAAREKEIEDKRQLALRQKKEQEEKAREEKRLAKEAAKAEKPATENHRVENGDEPKPVKTTSNFEILRKAGADDEGEADVDEETEGESKNGAIVEDKEVKPKEIVREMPPKERSDGQKGGSNAKANGLASEPSNAELEADGWSTVTAKGKNSRRGNHQANRAIAS